jgi:UDP-2,3-diacylglucosamine hydrolase
VLPSPCYVISDTHLGAAAPDVERALLGFLRSLRGSARSLVINGDLFDFWFEWQHVIPREGFRVLAALADLRDAGIEILWVAGNHDCWGGDFLTGELGVRYELGPWVGELAGWRTRLEHGDGLRAVEDRKYRALRTVIRHPASVWLYRRLHPDLGTRLASGSSRASRQLHRAQDEGAALRRVAMAQLASDRTLDLLVYGHSHVAALERAPSGGTYANAGSWLFDLTYLRVTPEEVSLLRWDPASAEGHRLDAVDRRAEELLADS